MVTDGPRRLKVALLGLGRLGQLRARTLAFQQPRIELVAVCDTKPGIEEWVNNNLPPRVRCFADPFICMKDSGAEAVLISTPTATHAALIHQGFDLGLHVMCEKPISIDLKETEAVLAKAASKPHLTFLVPFSRRYDDSYRAAKQLADNGDLGEIHAVESSILDQQDPTGFFVAFSAQSGGIFLDMGIHDIDIGRYFLNINSQTNPSNPKKQVKRVTAFGQTTLYPSLSAHRDCSNGYGIIEFANGKLLTTHVGRTLSNGHEGTTRVLGTKGHTIVNGNSAANRVEIRDAHGVRTATTKSPFELYEKSFVADLSEFADVTLMALEGKGRGEWGLTCRPEDAWEAAKIGVALQESFRSGRPVEFGEDGMPVLGEARVDESADRAMLGLWPA